IKAASAIVPAMRESPAAPGSGYTVRITVRLVLPDFAVSETGVLVLTVAGGVYCTEAPLAVMLPGAPAASCQLTLSVGDTVALTVTGLPPASTWVTGAASVTVGADTGGGTDC